MSPRRELKKNLANSEWMRQRVLPRLTGNSFGKFMAEYFMLQMIAGQILIGMTTKSLLRKKG